MHNNYICPYCEAELRVGNAVILRIETQDNFKGLMALNPKLGEYDIVTHESFQFSDGEEVEIFCPVCQANLKASNINSLLAKLYLQDETETMFDLYFSRIVGDHSTFKANKDEIIEKYGEDSSSYVNYFMSKLKKNLESG